MPEGAPPPLPAEDTKLVTLARSARVRAGAPEGAAVRDETGRTYVAASVGLRSLRLSALQAAVAAAVSSGAGTLEAAVVVGAAESWSPADKEIVAETVSGPAYLVRPDGSVVGDASGPGRQVSAAGSG